MLRGASVPTPSPTPSRALRAPALLARDRDAVAPLRTGRPVAIGGLGGTDDHRLVEGCQLVAATDMLGTTWWVPAAAVWTDAGCDGHACPDDGHPTQQPHPTGLATAWTATTAMLAGLSDRLGWEAVIALDRGVDLPVLDQREVTADVEPDPGDAIVLDGRVGHEVPTVVVLGQGVTRWGAGGTWAGALRRALYGGHGSEAGDPAELATVGDHLARDGLRPAYVDIGSDALRAHGITRASVQLLAL